MEKRGVLINQPRMIGSDYELGKEIGQGTYGTTYLCRHLITNETLACKVISKANITTQEKIENIYRELTIMMTLSDHPNIVKLKAFREDEDFFYFIMELCEGGELFDRIEAKDYLTEAEAAPVAKMIAKAVCMCHVAGVIHRDLKPENFLFLNNQPDSPLKLIDFGFSVFFKPNQRFSDIVGTLSYVAPEMLSQWKRHGPEVDIWSAGVIIYIMLCGHFPFYLNSDLDFDKTTQTTCAILKGDIDFETQPWPQISESAKSLIRQMLERDPKKRLTAQQVLVLFSVLVGEVGELSEIFQWKGEVPKGLPGWKEEEKVHLGEELSDVLLYLIRLSDMCGVDLGKAALRKIGLNAIKMIGSDYELGKEIGQGTYGTTYLCRHLVTNETLACKVISKANITTQEKIENIYRELTIMMTLSDHPNIVKLKAFREDEDFFYFIMELCEGGELFDRIEAKDYLTEAEAAPVAKMIAKAVCMCHVAGVIHRDLKPENFLFLNNQPDSPLKLIDFGFSVFFKPNQRFSDIVGTLSYVAPEMLSQWKRHGPEVDIWSAGVIIYIMLCGHFPFCLDSDLDYDKTTQTTCAILKGDIDFETQPWPQISESAKSLIRQMLERDPKKRLTAQQVLGDKVGENKACLGPLHLFKVFLIERLSNCLFEIRFGDAFSLSANCFIVEHMTASVAAMVVICRGLKPVLINMEDVLDQRRMIGNKYELGEKLGEGAYGVTYLCRDLVTHETLACKAISKAHMDTKEEIENIYNEVTIMMKLPDHPNIVKLKAFCEDRNNFYLIMELCKGGELVDLIKAKNYLSEAEAAPVAKMIVKAIMTCHTNGIMHRDLKPENLLFLNNKQDSPLKLIDFGFSAFFKPNQRFSNIVGTLYYAAPEILSKWKCHGPEVDIWSAGVIIYIMLCGNFPFYPEFSDDSSYDHSITQMSCAILKGDIDFRTQPWPRISESAKSLIRQMLERDPKKRLTAQQVLATPTMVAEGEWLTEITDSTENNDIPIRRRNHGGGETKLERTRLCLGPLHLFKVFLIERLSNCLFEIRFGDAFSLSTNCFIVEHMTASVAAMVVICRGLKPVLINMEDVLDQRRMIGNKYELGEKLGEGAYGVTYLCRDLVTHETLACKAISKAHMDTKEEIENIYNEVTIMMKLPDHPNIVKLKAFCEDRNNFYLIMELCKGGELVDLIKAKNYLSEAEAAPVAKMIVKAIMTCHTNGIMHRDLKPENLLFLNNKQDSPLKLIDFGFSAFFKPNQRFSNIVGTLYYAAPEILSKWKCHGPEVDIWSAGVIIYIMLCGNFPFYPEFSDDSSYDHSITQMSCAILKGDIDFQTQPWPRISESAKSLIRQMLERDPKKRLTAQQVLEHPWIQNA
ncbi:hypothetical protein F8388_009192 [Cannabis sativa]|uniref:Protein kinase domain-containing protein n=1 Tax=Cannabis sativa TaxID=3483 RepID=A0A7J6GJW4_CANSA|nr:hypothetical protein F8388_009192 [Cannabis sativa]